MSQWRDLAIDFPQQVANIHQDSEVAMVNVKGLTRPVIELSSTIPVLVF
jgi:hydrogenase maturation factor